MNRKWYFIIAVVVLILLAVIVKFFFLDRQTNSVSAFRVESFPKATLYLNDRAVGETPYVNENLQPGEYKIKLLVTGTSGTFLPWESKVKLTRDSLTYVNRNLAASDDLTSGQILWLEKLATGKSTELAVITDPDDAAVIVDDLPKGQSSLIIKDLTPGDHEIRVTSSGYGDQIIKGKLIEGYRLNAVIKLGKINPSIVSPVIPTPISTPSANLVASSAGETFPKPYVIVKETGTGFLRVRQNPDINSTESARVKPGEKYSLLSEVSGWDKIKIASSSGWVSDQFVQKVK